MTGDIEAIYTDDPRGPRYVVRGHLGEEQADIVCRFRGDGTLLIIITVYLID
jgi:hypothetical protein